MLQFNPSSKTESLYIHWPFCPYKCSFCPFVTVIGKDDFMAQYNDALIKEIQKFSEGKRHKIKTIYVGGGTPSSWPEKLLLDTFDTLKDEFDLDDLEEFCLEVNPGLVTESKLKLWKKIGINRLSIGVQSLKEKVLQSLSRMQSNSDVFSLLSKAPEYFENISVDLILGLPGVSESEWKDLLDKVVKWKVKHISVYFLTVHEGTSLYFGVKRNKVSLPPEESCLSMYDWTANFLNSNGFCRYEISSFAKPGYQSKHNEVYWSRKPFKGLGVGACSFDGKSRFQNEKNFLSYLEKIEKNEDISIFSEELSKDQEWLEALMLGIRQSKGVLLDELFFTISEEKKKKILEKIESLQKADFLRRDTDRVYLTHRGMGLENEVILQLVS